MSQNQIDDLLQQAQELRNAGNQESSDAVLRYAQAVRSSRENINDDPNVKNLSASAHRIENIAAFFAVAIIFAVVLFFIVSQILTLHP